MELRYSKGEMPDRASLIGLGLTWAIIASVFSVMIGRLGAGLRTDDPYLIILFIQKMMFFTGISIILQIAVGHRLPAMFGPSVIMLIACISSRDVSSPVLSMVLATGGICFVLMAQTRVLDPVVRLFTPEVTAISLVLVSLGLIPSILDQITSSDLPGHFIFKLVFAVLLTAVMFASGRYLKGFIRATYYLWILVLGSVAVFVLWQTFPEIVSYPYFSVPFSDTAERFFSVFADVSGKGAESVVESAGFSGTELKKTIIPQYVSVLFPVLICYLSLTANEIGSLKSVSDIISADIDQKCIRRTLTLTGLLNTVAGFFGIVGGVNYSISTGVIVENKNASEYPIMAGGLLLTAVSFSPALIDLFMIVPGIVTACLLLYVMILQMRAALLLLAREIVRKRNERQKTASKTILVICVIVTLGVSRLPESFLISLPEIIRLVFSNGFIAGMIVLILLEQIIARKYGEKSH